MIKTESEIAKILQWVRETDKKTLPYNIIGIGWGPKIKDTIETNEYAVCFTVLEKLPLSAISQEEIIPKSLNIDGITIQTDVQKAEVYQKLYGDCHVGPDFYNTNEPILSHRKKYRPLVGGISSISYPQSTDATLGLFVRDSTDGQIVALSNSHVYAGSHINAAAPTRLQNEEGSTNMQVLSARQPASSSYSPFGGTAVQDHIGTCKRAVLIGDINPISTSYNIPAVDTSCDAAIVQLNSSNLIDSSSVNIFNLAQPGPYSFATDSEIDSLLNSVSENYGAPVFRAGRTCGPVGFPGYTNSCNLSVYQFGTELVGLYSGHLGNFFNSFRVRGNVVPGRGGDSGSALLALFNRSAPSLSAWKVIGLLFAGPGQSFPTFTIGCRITTVAENLKIESWNGVLPTLSAESKTLAKNSLSTTVELSGRTYFQVGWQQFSN